jgi:hypothetical protein
MKRFVSKIVFCLWVGFIISCSSSAVYKPFSELSNAEIVGKVQVTFEAVCPNSVITDSVKNLANMELLEMARNQYIGNVQISFEAICPNSVITDSVKNLAYVELLKAAKTQYSGNIDIRDITVEKVENIEWATNKFKLAASGKVVQVGGGITTDKGNIDVCDITVEKIENIGWATNKFKLAATGKIVLIGGRGTTSEARGIEKVLARTLNDTLKNVLLSTGYGI